MREMIDFNGEKLRILREEKCLTQRELASHAGIPQVYLSKIECNHIIPRRAVCEKLAWVLRVDPDEFLRKGHEQTIKEGWIRRPLAPVATRRKRTRREKDDPQV